ncbi:hypothetical protein FSP39_002470 [Pinctada imbricata]|uniref:Uncharacterized protein n=1 Tax=Pinctada imbricata TaxID=66713 RepID=A0AA88XKM1_PINIB|nr:hypothetical protein FSP39_002470 [Pinctada imbricata]
MGTLKADVPPSPHWTMIRADEDIQSSVSQFLEDETINLRSKSLSESVVDVSRWLGSQIQRERDGWAYKVRMAMQEIESHRRETLKIQGLLQECTDQLRTIAGYANIDEETMEKIAEEEPKIALPMYIECISVLLNDLVEDRLRCLQIMKKKESDGMSISHILQSYLHKLQLSSDIMKKEPNGQNQ